jgi:hypothetical protein
VTPVLARCGRKQVEFVAYANNSELVHSRANRANQDISLNPKRTFGWGGKEDVTHG